LWKKEHKFESFDVKNRNRKIENKDFVYF